MIANEPDHVQDLLRVGAINVQRNTWGDTALVRYCKAVADAGVSSAELARVIGRSPKHTTRYLKPAGVAWLLEHVEKHHVAMTTAISLLETDHAGRFDELRQRIDAWVREVKEEIAAENVKRRNQGKKELSGRDLWPAKKLHPSQVDAWKRGLSSGDWTASAGLLKESLVQDGKVRVAGKSIDVAKADLRQLIALYESLGKTVADLEPLLLQKKAEQEAKADTSARADHRVSERLAELGIERPEEDGPTEVGGEVDEDFGGGPVTEEVDYSSTVELPEGDHHAAGFLEGNL